MFKPLIDKSSRNREWGKWKQRHCQKNAKRKLPKNEGLKLSELP